jgi:transposase
VQTALVQAAWAGSHTATRGGAWFRRLHRRFGKNGGTKAAVALAHTLVVILWHLFAQDLTHTGLGVEDCTRRDNPGLGKSRLPRQLGELGYHAELSPAA